MEEKQITVADLEARVEAVFEQRAKYEAAKDKASDEHLELQKQQAELINILEALELDSYKGKVGTFSYKYDESFRVPKDNESRDKFFGYLKEKGVFDDMITVNSQTLNSYAKEQAALAEEEGVLDFQIPGLTKGDPVAKPIMRKTK